LFIDDPLRVDQVALNKGLVPPAVPLMMVSGRSRDRRAFAAAAAVAQQVINYNNRPFIGQILRLNSGLDGWQNKPAKCRLVFKTLRVGFSTSGIITWM
jgi:hypothetical protein